MKLNEKKGSMTKRKSYLNVFELNQALVRQTAINRALTSLLLEKGVIGRDEWEKKLQEIEEEPSPQGSGPPSSPSI